MRKVVFMMCSIVLALNGFAKTGDIFINNGLEYVVIAETGNVQEVAVNKFYEPSSDVTIPGTVYYEGVTYIVANIANEAFKDCATLTNVSIPSNVKEIGKAAFMNCQNLSKVSLSEGLCEINPFAFSGCLSLTEINIPSTLIYLGRMAFAKCSKLTSLNLPKNIKFLGEDAFVECSKLNTVGFSANVNKIPDGLFERCSMMNEAYIPDGIISIGKYAFNDCSSITSIILPNSIEEIKEGAFAGCTALKAITLPNSIKNISSSVFKGNTKLSHVTLPSHLASLGVGDEGGLFDWCDDMTELTIPATVEQIGNVATFPHSLNSIFVMGDRIPDGLSNMSPVNRKGENITIYVKPSVFNNLYSSGEWNGFSVEYRIPIEMVNAKGNTVKYKTLCRDFDIDFSHTNDNLPAGMRRLSAYLVDDANGELGMVFMDEIHYIPSRLKANVVDDEGNFYQGEDEYVGIVVRGTPGYTYYYEIGENDYTQGAEGQWLLEDAQSASKAPHAGRNLMRGVADAAFVSTTEVNPETCQTMTNYGLSNNSFRKFSGPGWLNYNRSYLPLPESMSNTNFSMTFTDEDGTTDVISYEEFVEESENDIFYNPNGQRVKADTKGIVINNGKKIVNK